MPAMIQIEGKTKENLEEIKEIYRGILEDEGIGGTRVTFSMTVDYLLKFYHTNKEMVKTQMVK